MKNISKGSLLSISMPYPDPSEQTAIAASLSDADALIQSLEKLIAKKRNIKQGAMQELLKPKEGWVVKKLGEITDILTGFISSSGYVKRALGFKILSGKN
jgi:type I restriction enzyme S subunit